LIQIGKHLIDPPVKTLQKEERLELKAEIAKNNGQHPNGKKQVPEIDVDDELSNNPALEYTGRYDKKQIRN
jgi:hypothetical protein